MAACVHHSSKSIPQSPEILPSDWAPCTDCGKALDLHQPDVDDPWRLFGSCSVCRVWAEVTVAADGGMTSIALAPPAGPEAGPRSR